MSTESSNSPIDWVPSPALCIVLCALGLCAAWSIWLSNLSLAAKVVSMPIALGHAWWLARREWRRSPCTVQLSACDDTAVMSRAGEVHALCGVTVQVRAGAAWMQATSADGRRVRLLWTPDRLGANDRRALRLASGGVSTSFDPTLATLSG